MSGEGEGKLPSVDHGRRTDKGRDKNVTFLHVILRQIRHLDSLMDFYKKYNCRFETRPIS